LRTSFPNKTPAISKLELVLDIYPSLSLILRYIYCLVFQGASSVSKRGHVVSKCLQVVSLKTINIIK
ncbi:hypothetical protein, partial [Escherichia sp. MOD1-EC6163]|uniref:hypothetical protein n=1 Tax=Escherichia sp. MOD1-EC6163 TaxID=2093896 RepID=UPI001F239B09